MPRWYALRTMGKKCKGTTEGDPGAPQTGRSGYFRGAGSSLSRSPPYTASVGHILDPRASPPPRLSSRTAPRSPASPQISAATFGRPPQLPL